MADESASLGADDILSALRESGYLLEQQVATQVEGLGFHVETNWAYQDPEEGKSREIDVRAVLRRYHDEALSVFVEIVCECKNARNPLVFLSRSKNARDRDPKPGEMHLPFDEYQYVHAKDGHEVSTLIPAFHYLGLAPLHYYHGTARKATQICRLIQRNGRWEAAHDDVFSGILYPLAKAVGARKRALPRSRRDEHRYAWIFVPLLVTTAPMYEVDSEEPELRAQPISYITAQREIESKAVSGTHCVDFVSSTSVCSHIEERILAFADSLIAILTGNPAVLDPFVTKPLLAAPE